MSAGMWKKFVSPHGFYYLFMVLLLYAPLAVMIVFSFNKDINLEFPIKGFTLKWYKELFTTDDLLEALFSSLVVGLVSSLAATALGTMAAVAAVRFRFPGRDLFVTVGILPLVIPYLAVGVSLLLFFQWIGVPLSLWTVASAHAMMHIPYVMLIVSARLDQFENSLEEASMDLGATYWCTLLRIMLPSCAPVLLAGFLYSFAASFDEFDVAYFVTGTQSTLPVYLYSQLRFPNRLPLMLALASVTLLVSFAALFFMQWLRRRSHSAE